MQRVDVTQVRRHAEGSVSGHRPEVRLRLGTRIRLPAGDDHRRTRQREPFGDRTSNATCPACNDRHVFRGVEQRLELVRAFTCLPAGTFPQVSISDKYPIYAKCVELGVPIFCCAGVPGPRLRMAPQQVELIDGVMHDFPDLVFVTRHGCEPWTDLAVKLMVKWPGLHYSTSAFAPKYYPRPIIDYANSRGADKVI